MFSLELSGQIRLYLTNTDLSTDEGLTAVESLEASVISRLPLSPSRAGTRMKTSDTSVNTVQCWKSQRVISATQHQYDDDSDILDLEI